MFIGRTDAEAEAPILWPPDEKSWLIGKDHDAEKDWGQEEKGTTEGEMVGWYHWLNRHEFEETLGDGEGQGSLVAAVHGAAKRWTRLSDMWLNDKGHCGAFPGQTPASTSSTRLICRRALSWVTNVWLMNWSF